MKIPQRIVSLCPSITETLVEIGAGPRLVGVTRYCVRPREAVRRLPKVGGTKSVDLAAIEALAPDLIFANAEENRPEDLAALGRSYRLHVSVPRKVSEVAPVVRDLGVEAGEPERAAALAGEIERMRERLETPPARTFRFACFIWKDPWMAVSGDTYVSDLLRLAGGENVFAESDRRYPEVLPAEVLAREPDVLIFPSEPYPFGDRHRPILESVFGRHRPMELLEGDDCCWHGARTRNGLALMDALRGRWGAA